MKFDDKEIISTSTMQKFYSKCRNMAKKSGEILILKNNKPDMILMDFEKYEKLLDILEQFEINKLVQDFDKNDDGKRYSIEEAMNEVNK